jgi:hypothetical protein
MIMQNVFIINFNSLYEILDEIKENLFFKVIKLENENSIKNKSDLDIINSLIISKTSHDLLSNKTITENNILNLNDSPMSLSKLLEFINLKLMKLKFSYQAKINVNDYELNLNSKLLSKDGLNLKLTEKETEIILYLHETKKNRDVAGLKKNIWRYSVGMETHTVETHIYRLRKKILKIFDDKNFIVSQKDGYQII